MIAVPQIGEEEDGHVNHVPKSLLVGIIAPRLEETFELVRNRLEASGFDKVAGRRVVLTGGACQLHGAREFAGLILDKQVRIGRPLRVAGLAEATQRSGVFDDRRAVAFRLVGARRDRRAPARIARPSGIFGRLGHWLQREFLRLTWISFGSYPCGTDVSGRRAERGDRRRTAARRAVG